MADFFNDMPEEATETGEQLADEQLQEFEQNVTAEDLGEQDVSSVLEAILTEEELDTLEDARMRLDKAKLYEIIMQNNIFAGIAANPRAVLEVQSELKDFALDRLETLMGMKAKKQVEVQAPVSSPFNDVETMALRDIAAKLTKGDSLRASAPAQQGLRPLQQKTNKAPQAAPIQRPVAPIARKAAPVQQVVEGERPALSKKPSEMTAQELIEHNKRIPVQKRGTSSRAMPMPDADQKQMIHMKNGAGGNEGSAIMGLLSKMGKLDVQTLEDVGNGDGADDVNTRF